MTLALIYWVIFKPYKYKMYLHYLDMYNDNIRAFKEVKERYD